MLEGIAVCLVDLTDELRCGRLTVRDAGRWDAPAVDPFLRWAAWHREHARDPRHRPEVIINDSWSRMAWHRWTGWRWVTEQRDALRSGRLPLSRGWAAPPVARADHDS
ncbi:hypothetical protein ACFVP3_01575 [Streptomyces sp. NPDC057806]|uniref:hypothetical protein n=1 Tax=Streptomyces sp. NPDC057806 TaxID=3346255 RepID=UPI00368AD535